MDKKIILSGSTGFIGKNLNIFLKKKKFKILKYKKNKNNFKKINLSKFSHFIHAGFDTRKNCIVKEQVRILKEIIHLAKKYSINIIFLSTSASGKSNERKILSNNRYQIAKKRCEEILINENKNGLKVIILRIFNLYGPYQKKNYIVSDLLSKFLKKKCIYLKNYGNSRDLIFIEDLCNAIYKILMLKQTKFEIFEIGSGKSYKLIYIAYLIKKLINSKKKIIKLNPKNSYPKTTKALIKKTTNKIKWEPVISLKKGILNTIKFYEKNSHYL